MELAYRPTRPTGLGVWPYMLLPSPSMQKSLAICLGTPHEASDSKSSSPPPAVMLWKYLCAVETRDHRLAEHPEPALINGHQCKIDHLMCKLAEVQSKPTSMLVAAGLWYSRFLPRAHDGSILPCCTAVATALRACMCARVGQVGVRSDCKKHLSNDASCTYTWGRKGIGM